MKRPLLIVCALGLGSVGPAVADVITINPSNYVPGRNISNVTPGATLSAVSYVPNPDPGAPANQAYVAQSSPVFATPVTGTCNLLAGSPCAATGTNVLGYSPGSLPVQLPSWGQGNPAGQCVQGNCDPVNGAAAGSLPVLRVDFTAPTDSVSALIGFTGDPNGGWLEAFNSQNQEVGLCHGSPGAGFSPCAVYPAGFGPGWGQFSITDASNDISSVLIGGDGSYAPVGEVQFATAPVPEPATIGLFAAGLAALLLTRRRRVDCTNPIRVARRSDHLTPLPGDPARAARR
jgi:hypothetical protein